MHDTIINKQCRRDRWATCMSPPSGGGAISPLSGGGPVEERRKPNNINNVGGYMFECGMV